MGLPIPSAGSPIFWPCWGSLPALLLGATEVNWPALLLLAVAPQLALLAQGLSGCANSTPTGSLPN
jgi:heat shock protein HtpX